MFPFALHRWLHFSEGGRRAREVAKGPQMTGSKEKTSPVEGPGHNQVFLHFDRVFDADKDLAKAMVKRRTSGSILLLLVQRETSGLCRCAISEGSPKDLRKIFPV